MIYLITGLPGNGKTLYTLWHVKDRAEKENRQVYYSGIPDLKIESWIELKEPEKWHELPKGAIIVMDEAQRVFRPRGGRSDPPEHVSKLETHRHDGHDLYIITQHPALIDQAVRRLAGTHRHVQRTFGAMRAVIHEWGEVHMDCERKRTDSSKTIWKYPKNVFGLYKSAELHTHKLQLPKQVYWLAGLTVVLLLLFAKVYTGIEHLKNPEGAPTAEVEPAAPGAPGVEVPATAPVPATQPEERFIEQFEPRIAGFPHTAPRYDEITKPVEAPVVAGCVQMGTRCTCYSQRGTPLNVGPEVCASVIASGVPFYDFQLARGDMAPRSKSLELDHRRQQQAARDVLPEVALQ